MVHLELSDTEANDLRASLSIRVVGMREELAHTDNREYRADLRATKERIEAVLTRLEQLIGPAPRA